MEHLRTLSGMRRALSCLSVSLCFTILLFPAKLLADESTLMLGAGVGYNEGIFEGQDGYVYPEPVFNIDYGLLYANNSTVAIKFANYRSVSFALAATLGQIWLDVGDINSNREVLYYGIEDRDRAVEAGLLFHYRSPVGLVSMAYYKDVSSTHDASRGLIKIERNIAETGDYISITPGLYINYYSSKYNKYYFGVTEEENLTGADIANNTPENFSAFRPEYSPGNSGHLGFDLKVEYELSREFVATGYLAIEDLTGQWETSPLVEDKGMGSVVFGISYRFQ